MPAMLLNSSAAKCVALPLPPDENSKSFGLAFAIAISSLTDLTPKRRIHDQHGRHADGGGDAGEILRIVDRRRRKRRQDDVGRRYRQQRVAVRRGLGDRLGRDGAARARAVFNHHRLLQGVGEPLADDAGRQIDGAARGEPGDHADRPVGIFRDIVSGGCGGRRKPYRCKSERGGSDRGHLGSPVPGKPSAPATGSASRICGGGSVSTPQLTNRSRSCGAVKSSSGPSGTMPVGLTLRWLP